MPFRPSRSIAVPRARRKTLILAVVGLLAAQLVLVDTADAYQVPGPTAAPWTGSATSASATLPSGVTATVAAAEPTYIFANNETQTSVQATSSMFDPPINTGTQGLRMRTRFSGCSPGTATCNNRGTVTVSFSQPVRNPVLYASGWGGTSTQGNPPTRATVVHAQMTLTSSSPAGASLTSLSGGATNMALSGALWTAANRQTYVDCQNTDPPAGATSTAACGSVRVNGTVSSVTFAVSARTTATVGGGVDSIETLGDQWVLTVSADEDFGDAPAGYDSAPAASHMVGDLKIGAGITADNTATLNPGSVSPSPNAGPGANGDTDDGVTLPPLTTDLIGSTYSVPVALSGASKAGRACGWIDFDRNGSFATSERSCGNFVAGASSVTLPFSVPTTTTAGPTYARFRVGYTSGQVQSPTGLADSGEVEDYLLHIKPVVRVLKSLDPTSDPGLFNLRINGTTFAANVGNGGDTGFRSVYHTDSPDVSTGTNITGAPVTVTLAESAGTATTLGDYTSTYVCVNGLGTTVASGTGTTTNVTLPQSAVGNGQQQNIACLYLNLLPTPSISVLKSGALADTNADGVDSTGDTITYTFTVENTGNVTLDPVAVSDPLPGLSAISCPASSLSRGTSMDCTATYVVTQTDVDAGSVDNTVTATGTPPSGPNVSDTDDETVPLAAEPTITLTKTGSLADTDGDGVESEGDVITYTFDVENTGNVTLSTVGVTDPLSGLSAVTCPSTTLAPGISTSCTATYTLTQADVDSGSVDNTATATGTPPTGPAVTDADSESVTLSADPSIALTKTGSLADTNGDGVDSEGDIVTYTFNVENTGNVTLDPIAATDPLPGLSAITCPTTTLAPGDNTDCTATYTLTQTDVDSGSVDNTATASGTPPSGPDVTDADSETISLTADPSITLSKTGSWADTNSDGGASPGDVIAYTFAVENTGNLTLDPVGVTDPLPGLSAITCPATTLAPGDDTDCTATYTLTQTDVDAGSVINTATATGTPPSGPDVSDIDPATVDLTPDPAVALVKTGSLADTNADGLDSEGDVITYTFNVENTGNVTLDPIAVTDPLTGLSAITCPATTLAPGNDTDCTATYTLTQTDIDTGQVDNTATASGTPPSGPDVTDTDDETIPLTADPAVALVKTGSLADTNADGVDSEGDVITYTFNVENTGNVTLDPIAVTDPLTGLSAITCPATTLAPGNDTDCTATYTLTQTDVDSGSVDNTATATGTPPSGPDVTDADSETVTLTPDPAVAMVKTGSLADTNSDGVDSEGDIVTYTFNVENTGNVTLSTVGVTDPLSGLSAITCPTTTLAPGDDTDCTATYTLTQTDIDTGQVDNTATATGTPPAGPDVTDTDDDTITLTADPALALVKTGSLADTNSDGAASPGDIVTYTLNVENTGNVTLDPISVTDPLSGLSAITCPTTTLAPGDDTDCTATYTLTQTDIDAGSVINTATATGTPPTGPDVSDIDPATVDLTPDPAVALVKTGSLADTNADGVDSEGDVITYTFNVENTGNVTLDPIAVTDPLTGLSAITCPATTLAPGNDTDCTATYTLTQTDIDAGSVDNTATATGTPPSGPDVTDADSETVTLTPDPAVAMVKTGSLADTNSDGVDSEGDIVTYTFNVENTGNVTLSTVGVTDPLSGLSAITCPTTTLAPGDDTDCTATYTLTQTDIDTGQVDNTATATGTPPAGPDVTDTDDETITLTADPALALVKTGSLADTNSDGAASPGDIVTYTLNVENTGNVTLDPISVTDPLSGLSAITCPATTLAPGDDTDCTATYTLTQTDVDAGSVINTATATGTPPTGPDVSDIDPATVDLTPDPDVTLVKTGSLADTNADGVDSEGDVITYTFNVENTGNVTLDPIAVTDPLPGLSAITCPVTSLAPGADTDCTATYTLTQTDIDTGQVDNTATATGTPPTGPDVTDTDDETIPLTADPDITLDKTGSLADTNGDSIDSEGDIVTYTFTVENTGNVTLDPIAVTDPLPGLSAITCPATTLAPGNDTDCTATYTLTQTDIDAGSVINTATATGTPPTGPDVTDIDPATVDLTPDPAVTLVKTGSLADTDGDGVDSEGDIVTYTFTVENTGNVTLSTVGVTDPLTGLSAITCPTTTLAPGDDTDCTATYTLTQTDIDTGQVDNTATATGTPPTGPDVTDTDSETVTLTPAPEVTLTKTGSLADTNADGLDSEGDIVTYTFTVENTGNVTLTTVGVTDPLTGLSAITCPATTLAPGDDTDCTATYTLTQADIDTGQVDNTATATGTPPTGPDVTDTDDDTVTLTPDPAISILKTGSLADTNADGVDSEGDIVTYTFTVENTGNVTLTTVGVTDPLSGLSAITCPVSSLAPGDDTECTATYTLTQTDVDAGSVINTATATGTPPTGPDVSDTDPATVDLSPAAELTLAKTGSLADTNSDGVDSEGDIVTYTFTVENTGNVTLTTVGVTDPMSGLSAITCPTTTLAPGAGTDCTATYALTQADVDAGQVDNTATATATPPTGPDVTDTDDETITLTPDPAISILKTGSLADTNADGVDSEGDIVTYTFTVENTGNLTLDPISVTDPLSGLSAITCPTTSLAPGADTDCTATYTLTQTDIDAGSVINTATTSGTPPTGPDVTDTDPATVDLSPAAELTLVKTSTLADTNSDGVDSEGDIVTYTFTVENTGNVTLDPIGVTDPLSGLSAITCPTTTLAPGDDTDCTATYTVTQTDIDTGQVVNTATASGTPPTGPDVTDTDSETIPLTPDPAVALVKTGTLADTNSDGIDSEGDVVTYTLNVENTGNLTLDPIAVTDPLPGLSAITCPATSLAPGADTDCTATYTLTQTDIDTGSVVNTATATGTPPTGPDVTDTDPATVDLTPDPAVALVKTGTLADTNADGVDSEGDIVTYTFTVENTGNVTLDPIGVTDPLPGLSTVTCGSTTLAPGADTDCTATYALTQADVDAGQVDNTATASGTPPTGPDVTDTDDDTVTLTPDPDITLDKTGTLADTNSDGIDSEGDVVTYTLNVENTGNVTLDPIGVTDPLPGLSAITCPATSLAPGADTDCTATYTLTQTDIDTGSVVNTATATGTPPTGPDVTDTDPATVDLSPAAELTLVKTGSLADTNSDGVDSEGDIVTYTFTVENTGSTTLSSVAVADPLSGLSAITCPASTLAPGDDTDCTATYTLTQADIDTGQVDNTATATGTPPTGPDVTDTDDDTVTLTPDPAISILKTGSLADTNADGVDSEGDIVTYTFTVENTGNVTLTTVGVTDPLSGLSAITCPVSSLAPGDDTECTATYTLTQTDVDAGSVINTATATGTPPTGPDVSDTDPATVDLSPAAELTLAKTGSLADTNSDGVDSEGDIVTYTFTVENTGNVTLTTVGVTDPMSGLSAITCPTTTLAPGAGTDCTATYALTQADVDAGQVDNTATATATPPTGPDVTDTDDETITLTPDPAISILKTGSLADTNADGVDSEGDIVTYTFTVENTGNLTLDPISVTDPLSGLSSITCPTTSLAPGADTDCTATYTLTQTDIDAGSVINTATTSGTPPTGPDVTDTDPATVDLTPDPDVTLDKIGTLADTNADGIDSEGDIVTYTFTVENTGNLTLDPIAVADPLPGLSAITCPTSSLNPGDDTDCTATYTLTQTDVDTGSVDNTATAGGLPPTGPMVSDTDDETVTLTSDPAVALVKTSSLADTNGDGIDSEGDVVTYTFNVENTGNLTLTAIGVTDPLSGLSAITCPVSTLAPGADTDCTATYTLTQADVDNGRVDNTATATGTPPSGPDVSDTDDDTVTVRPAPEVTLTKTGSLADTNGDSIDSEGDIVTYTFTVENTGNLTLDPIAVTDPLSGLSAITCPTTALAPGDDTDCTATYTLTQTDIDTGQVDNTATATGTPPTGPDVTDTDSETVTLTPAPEVTLTKTGSLADTNADGLDSEGDVITYTFNVENSGGATLSSIIITDPLPGLSAITCAVTTLAPGVDTDCTATYALTQTDVDNGQVDNTATATGTPPTGPDVTDTDSTTVPVDPSPGVSLAKSGRVVDAVADGTDSTGDVITYTFAVQNTGNVTLNPVSVADPLPGLSAITCPFASLAPGATGNCTADYSLTQADVDVGLVDNTATATGTPPTGPPVEDQGSTTVPLDSRSVIGSAKALAGVTNNGDGTSRVSLLLTIENLGATTLTDLVLTDDVVGQFSGLDPRTFDAADGSLVADPGWDGSATSNVLAAGQDLEPGRTGTVSIAFTVTPGDVTSRTNTAEAAAIDPFDAPVTDTSTDGIDPDPNGDGIPDEDDPTVVPFDENPRIGAAKRVAAGPVPVAGGQAVTYEITVANVGDVRLDQVQAVEDLAATFAGVESFAVDRLTSDALTVNPTYDGTGDTDLLTGTDSLAAGESGAIVLRVVVVPGSATGPFENQVTVSGISPAGVTVSDRSTDGDSVDPDGDGDPSNDSTPTSVTFRASTPPAPIPAAPTRPNPLPATGRDSATAAQLAAAMMAVGSVLLLAGRRRRDELATAKD